MHGYRGIAALVFAMVLGALSFEPAPVARADLPAWNGKYSLVRYAAQKTGTSLAARQPEPTFSDDYDFATKCSATACVATVSGGAKPKNPTLPQPPEYTWDGAKWVHIYDWQWDCYMGEGRAETMESSTVVGVLHATAGRLTAGHVADQHLQRPLLRHGRHGRGRIRRDLTSSKLR